MDNLHYMSFRFWGEIPQLLLYVVLVYVFAYVYVCMYLSIYAGQVAYFVDRLPVYHFGPFTLVILCDLHLPTCKSHVKTHKSRCDLTNLSSHLAK